MRSGRSRSGQWGERDQMARCRSKPGPRGHVNEVNRVAFSADGRMLAAPVMMAPYGLGRTLGRAIWRTIGWVPDPVRVLNHEGWRGIQQGDQPSFSPRTHNGAKRLRPAP